MPTREKIATQGSADTPSQTPCPTCHEPADSSVPTAPFCSDRCRLVDLGKWFDEKYVISRDIKDADLDQGE